MTNNKISKSWSKKIVFDPYINLSKKKDIELEVHLN